MNILLLGSGGREHALAWKLAQSAVCDTLWAAPGNPGIAKHAQIMTMDVQNHAEVVAFCAENAVGLVVVGPEAPLVDGLGDALRAAGVPVFGPSQQAAQLEGSKGFTKDLCARAGIPTAGYERVASQADALAALARFGAPVVIKADGLAAGKGVTVAMTMAEAEAAVADIFAGRFGAGAEAVIEEFMEGEEASFFALSDGTAIMPFASAQDHKRVGEGDTGPNTGGMGAYSPARVLTPDLQAQVMETIIAPTVATLAAEGMPYSGVLFAGLMLTDEGPKLIEYNARFGDPECQVMLSRLESDLGALLLACAKGELAAAQPPRFSEDVALTVVMAARNYPDTPEKGSPIRSVDAAEAAGPARIFHAGTALAQDALVAAGGRVLNVTARGPSVGAAQAAAYRAVDALQAPGLFCRRDIGWREVAREQTAPN
jgi:phosphoribosylamine--glycine ligase